VTTAVEAIEALRAAVTEATQADDEAMRAPSVSPAFAAFDVVRVPGEAALGHVTVRLAEPVKLSELEAAFGPGRRLPRRPEGGPRRTVIFDETIPAENSAGATLLADVEGDDLVSRLVVRRDVL
jgi:hypothetical protein